LDRRNTSNNYPFTLVKPAPLDVPNWDNVKRTVIAGVERSCAEGYEDEDFKHYVYEAAMIAIYGPDYFKWRNSQNW
jgi:hypothetical protein